LDDHQSSGDLIKQVSMSEEGTNQFENIGCGGMVGTGNDDDSGISGRRVDSYICEVEIRRHDYAAVSLCPHRNLIIWCGGKADIANVYSAVAYRSEERRNGARKAGIDQEIHDQLPVGRNEDGVTKLVRCISSLAKATQARMSSTVMS
jgi:hypothetical protein